MRLLALATTTPHGSVAILENEEVRAETRTLSESHSLWVVSALPNLAATAGITLREVDGYAVASGPGSFTGLRVGLEHGAGARPRRRPALRRRHDTRRARLCHAS